MHDVDDTERAIPAPSIALAASNDVMVNAQASSVVTVNPAATGRVSP
ncbi:MAG: hypothetical protein NT062_06175 [Proteobacteria bacterium]|nr:hypothetical protein [Pseudomonadota bacterium]